MFFSRGAVVYVVEGSHAPGVALHAGGTVLALGANDADLFVQTGLRVTEYSRAHRPPAAALDPHQPGRAGHLGRPGRRR